jgi:glycosyltransferase involved in cell wall biosynthesis
MKALIVYEFGKAIGGGDFVMLNIVSALADMNLDVTLAYPSTYMLLKSIVNLSIDPQKYINTLLKCRLKEYKQFHKVPHPYSTYLISHLETRNDDYTMFIFSDDLPKIAKKSVSHNRNTKTILYVHYPHSLRVLYSTRFGRKYSSSNWRKIIWNIHRRLFGTCFELKPKNAIVLVNSLYTLRHIIVAYHDLGIVDVANLSISQEGVIETKNIKIALLNPPVEAKTIYKKFFKPWSKKEDLAVFLGAFTRDKDIEILVKAFKELHRKGVDLKLVMMGFCDKDPSYVRGLVKSIRMLNIEHVVRIVCNPSRELVLGILSRAKFIVHPHRYEPFGIAILEAMAAGCTPIVRKGPNGPWKEIVDEGRYGYGFETVDDLVKLLINLTREEKILHTSHNTVYARRAIHFDEAEFRKRFTEIFKRTVYA